MKNKPLWSLLETVAILGCMTGIGVFFGVHDRFLTITPHPFWIVILVMTVRYGTVSGMLATLTATAFLYIGNWPEQTIEESIYAFQFRLSLLPTLWFITSFILGELKAQLVYENERLKEQLSEKSQHAETITEAYYLMKATKENFETRYATFSTTPARLLQRFIELQGKSKEEIHACIPTVVECAIGPCTCTTSKEPKANMILQRSCANLFYIQVEGADVDFSSRATFEKAVDLIGHTYNQAPVAQVDKDLMLKMLKREVKK